MMQIVEAIGDSHTKIYWSKSGLIFVSFILQLKRAKYNTKTNFSPRSVLKFTNATQPLFTVVLLSSYVVNRQYLTDKKVFV